MLRVTKLTSNPTASAGEDDKLLELVQHEQRQRGLLRGDRGQIGADDEVRVEEAGHDGDAGDVHGRRRGQPFTAASMGLSEHGKQRRHRAKERKDRVPAQPGDLALDQELFNRPADQADARHGEAEGDGGPEEPVTAGPDVSPPHDDDDPGEGGGEQSDDTEPDQDLRTVAQPPSNSEIRQGVEDAARKPGHQSLCRLMRPVPAVPATSTAGSRRPIGPT